VEYHSKKPDEVRRRIEQLMGDVPRAELFARQRYDGWVCLGDEIDGLDIREAIKQVKEMEG
jgi:N6-adenosine-specific RNA methylase IME4